MEGNERHDVGSPDPGVDAAVPAQVDKFGCPGNGMEGCFRDCFRGTGESDYGTIVIAVGVSAEDSCARLPDGGGQGGDGGGVAANREVRNTLDKLAGQVQRRSPSHDSDRPPIPSARVEKLLGPWRLC